MSFVIARRAVVVGALSLVSAGLAAAPAFAHGPSRQKVVETIQIDAPAKVSSFLQRQHWQASDRSCSMDRLRSSAIR